MSDQLPIGICMVWENKKKVIIWTIDYLSSHVGNYSHYYAYKYRWYILIILIGQLVILPKDENEDKLTLLIIHFYFAQFLFLVKKLQLRVINNS